MPNTINGTLIYNGAPLNGATAKLFNITAFCSYAASGSTVSDNPLAATSVELNTSSGAPFSVGQYGKMDSEIFFVRGKATNKLYIIRGLRGTAAASHTLGTAINIETITPPAQDATEPAGGFQQGATLTTGVNYGGDGCYRWTGVPEGDWYAMLSTGGHRAYVFHQVALDDVSPEQILLAAWDLLLRNSDGYLTRFPIGGNGQYFRVKSDGTGYEFGVLPAAGMDYQQFTSSGTWNKPSGKTLSLIEVVGGGGGGGGGCGSYNSGGQSWGGGGGGGGQMVQYLILTANLGATETVTVGAVANGGGGGTSGGNATATNGSNGSPGNQSSFGTTFTALVAAGGGLGNYGQNGGGGTAGASGTVLGVALSRRGGNGSNQASLCAAGDPATVTWPNVGLGGTGGGSGNGPAGNAGANSLGGGGASAAGKTGATPGTGYTGGAGGAPGGGGGGGGGTFSTGADCAGGTGGQGAKGEVRVWSW